MYCPQCKEEFEGELSNCPKCNYDFDAAHGSDPEWIVVAKVSDKTSADFAKATLKSYDIPVAVLSESGFLGNVGMVLPSMSGKGLGQYHIHTPAHLKEEALNIIEMVLGKSFERIDEDNYNE